MTMNTFKFPNKKKLNENDEFMYNQIYFWINSPAMISLLKLYGFNDNIDNHSSFIDYLKSVLDFVEVVFNFRRNNTIERQQIRDGEFEIDNRKILENIITELGLPGTKEVQDYELQNYPSFDWILVLGGNPKPNISNVELSKKYFDLYDKKNRPNVIGLCSERIINTENHAITEFENMVDCLESIYNLSNSNRRITLPKEFQDNLQICGKKIEEWDSTLLNMSWRKCSWNDTSFFSLSAPSSRLLYRATTMDTIKHFLNTFKIHKHEKILIINSSRYRIPTTCLIYRELSEYIIKNELSLFYSGVVGDILPSEQISSYLSEIRSSVDQMYKLLISLK